MYYGFIVEVTPY